MRDDAGASDVLPGASLIIGDARDVSSLRQAAAGQDAVVDALGSSFSGPFKEVTLFSESTKALIEAMTAAGVRRLVCITGVGAGDSRGHGGFLYDAMIQPILLRGVYADKDRQEELIRASDLDWVIVRPAMLADGPAVGGTQALTDLDGFHGGSITRADTAVFVLDQLASDTWLRKAPLIVHSKGAATTDGTAKLPSPYDVDGNFAKRRRVFFRQPLEGHFWYWLDGDVRFLALGHEVDDRYMIEVAPTAPDGGPVPHVHSREDEFFYVLEGGPIEFIAGDQSVHLGPGGFINLSSGTAHHFKNRGAPARLLCFNAPAGFDRFQIEGAAPWNEPGATVPSMPEIGKRLAALGPSYGVSLSPAAELFQRAPVVRVVDGETTAPMANEGVSTLVLAGPEHTGGRYAAALVNLDPGARINGIGHPIASTGLYVVSGEIDVDAGDCGGASLQVDGFAHLSGGTSANMTAGDQQAAKVLVWHAPGLAVPNLGTTT